MPPQKTEEQLKAPAAEGKDRTRIGQRTIFVRILLPLLLLLFVELAVFAGMIYASGVISRLNQNDRDLLQRQVLNRKNYLENYMVQTVGDLSELAETINYYAESLVVDGEIDLAQLDRDSTEGTPLIRQVAGNMVQALREKSASGIFLIFNTQDISERYASGDFGDKPGIYIRDMDPGATPSARNEDLTLERASSEVVQALSFATGNEWKPMFSFSNRTLENEFDFFYRPFQSAYNESVRRRADYYAFWGVAPFSGDKNNPYTLTYTIPLILPDGTVYGVLGVDLMPAYVKSLLPYEELFYGDDGTYMMVMYEEDDLQNEAEDLVLHPVELNGYQTADPMIFGKTLQATTNENGGLDILLDNRNYYACLENFELYSTNTPFTHKRWGLLGAVRTDQLFSFSAQMLRVLVIMGVMMLIAGVTGAVLIGRNITEPIRRLSEEVEGAAKEAGGVMPELPGTGILEIDRFTGAITKLSRDIDEQKEQEQKRIERERDHDLLTHLMNRRSFNNFCKKMFATPDLLKHAAMVMLDLDNLKEINDRFGHDWGDQYISIAADAFRDASPDNARVARVSGDEFYILYYGYDTVLEIREQIDHLRDVIAKSHIDLGEEEGLRSISCTGGVAWYPEDAMDFSELMKLADFAMYESKTSEKGTIGDFDREAYHRRSSVIQRMKALDELLADYSLAKFYFQPIFSAKTGEVHAYESLMRVTIQQLTSPTDVLELARQERRMLEIERMTWMRTLECFRSLRSQHMANPDAMLFINSIASISLNEEELTQIAERNRSLMPQVVIEITEGENMNEEATRIKSLLPGFSGYFALDDYGSGYNSEKMLLELTPRYIKVDISIIQDIDTSSDKQRIVSNIVRYAHERNMLIIAEGIEKEEELKTVIRLGVDLLQGYFLAIPAEIPQLISEKALHIIRDKDEEK